MTPFPTGVVNISPQTSNSSQTAYCTNAEVLQCYTKQIIGDMLRVGPSYPPPSTLACLDTSNPAGSRLYFHLQEGAGEIESACAIALRYTPLDLQNLTGVSQVLLIKLNAARGFWSLAQFLKPLTARMEDVPMAKESYELLQLLRDGDRIFSFSQTEQAGLPSVIPPRPQQLLTPNALKYAQRLFPSYLPRGIVNFPNGGGGGGS